MWCTIEGKSRKNFLPICNLGCQSGEQVTLLLLLRQEEDRKAEKRRTNTSYNMQALYPKNYSDLIFRIFITKLIRKQANNLNTDEIQVNFTKLFKGIMAWRRHDRQMQCCTIQIQYNLQNIFGWGKNSSAKQADAMSHKQVTQMT